MKLHAILILLISMTFTQSGSAASMSEAQLWSTLKEGRAVAMMRHALAPGTGDPDNFDVTACKTQRNLNGTGRDQADKIGQRFRANGIEKAQVLSSAWCRCLDTAELLKLGPVENLPALNSFFRNFETEAQQTADLITWLSNGPFATPVVFVTHQVNITALTGIFPQSGEIIVIEPTKNGPPTVLGRMPTPTD